MLSLSFCSLQSNVQISRHSASHPLKVLDMEVIVLSLSFLARILNWLIPSLLFKNSINSNIGFKQVRARLTLLLLNQSS